jgi:Protein of unknown function (DUF2752)
LQHPVETINTRAPHETSHLYSQRSVPLGGISQMLLVVFEVLILTGFGLAYSVTPDPSGRGTHQQFGLPPCVILTLTKIPCPTCGMTTSFAHFVRGSWQKSAEANTSGFLLSVLSLCFLPWSLISLFRREWWLMRNPERCLAGLSLGWLSVVILEWVTRNFLS